MKFLSVLTLTLFLIFSSCKKESTDKPVDFDAFWKQSLTDLNKTPLDFKKVAEDRIVDDKKISLYKIRSYQDIWYYAWISEPLKEGKYPVKIRFSGYGGQNLKDDKIVNLWFLKQKGFINMLVDIRGQGLSTEQINPKDYLTEGINDPENFIYRGAYMDAVRAVDFVATQTKNNSTIIVTGGSQGGALSIAAAALNKKVKLCVSNFPFLTDMRNYSKKEWPMKIWLHEAMRKNIDYFNLHKTLSYFDILNFADKITVPVFIRTEETDHITPPEGAVKLFNRIENQKKVLYIEPCKGHGCSTNSAVANEMERVFVQNFIHSKTD